MRAALLAALLVLAASAVAHADAVVTANGFAQIGGSDTAAARTKALDDAFRQAVEQEVGVLADPRSARANADVIKRRLLRRARTFVLKFKVIKEGADDGGVYKVQIEATVADAALVGELRALGVTPAGAAPPVTPQSPEPPPAAPEPAPAPPVQRPSLALLAVTSDPPNVWASFGKGADDPGPAAPLLLHEVEALGFSFTRAAGANLNLPTAVGEAPARPDEPPLDLNQSIAVARQLGAGGAVVASITIKDGGRIRGTPLVGAEVNIALRVDDAGANPAPLVSDMLHGAGFGADRRAAVAAAAHDAAARAGRSVAPRLQTHWPAPDAPQVAEKGVRVRIHGVSRWPDVDPLLRAIAGVPGVKQVLPSRFAAREITLLVRGAPAAVVADVIARTPVPDARVAAQLSGEEISVDLSPDVTHAPPALHP